MTTLFLRLLNMAIAASWLMVAVMLVRLVMKRMPRNLTCLLWGLVAIRLIVPFSIESVWSLLPRSGAAVSSSPLTAADAGYVVNTGIPMVDYTLDIGRTAGGSGMTPLMIESIIWMIGLTVMLIYAVVSYIRLKGRVREHLFVADNIWLCDRIDTPFVFGIIRPQIYLPSTMNRQQMAYVMAHEQAHISRRDHWWKPVGFALLAVYWFNPICWIAYILFCRDLESACDERAIRDMNHDQRQTYSKVLLSCSTSGHFGPVTPLAFGEVSVKSRIKDILNYKKPKFWMLLAGLAICVVVAVCFLTTPKRNASGTDGETGIPQAVAPFGQVYTPVEMVYEAPQFNSVIALSDLTDYFCTVDQTMLMQVTYEAENGKTTGVYSLVGYMSEITLNTDNFDELTTDMEDGSYGLIIDNLRSENKQAWSAEMDTSDIFYDILQQNNGDIYLAYGYKSDVDNVIRLICRMEKRTEEIVDIVETEDLVGDPVDDAEETLEPTGEMTMPAAGDEAVSAANSENIKDANNSEYTDNQIRIPLDAELEVTYYYNYNRNSTNVVVTSTGRDQLHNLLDGTRLLRSDIQLASDPEEVYLFDCTDFQMRIEFDTNWLYYACADYSGGRDLTDDEVVAIRAIMAAESN